MLWRVCSITMHGALHKQTHRYYELYKRLIFHTSVFHFSSDPPRAALPTRKLFHFFPTFPTFCRTSAHAGRHKLYTGHREYKNKPRKLSGPEKRPNGKASAKRRLNWHTYSGKCKDIGAYAVNFPLGPSFPGKTREGNVPFRARLIMQTLFVQIIQIASPPTPSASRSTRPAGPLTHHYIPVV